MFDGITPTKFGQYRIAVPLRASELHVHDGTAFQTTDWEPPVPVLDQEDLEAQGIDTSALIPGAQRVNALGSCTGNSGIEHLAQVTAQSAGQAAIAQALAQIGLSGSDAVADEEQAILLYHNTTMQTGNPSTEYPPADCGSSGFYILQELERQGLIAGKRTAARVRDVASLLQERSVMVGLPFFKAWMEPDSQGFLDGDGSLASFMSALSSGVAGGHEMLISALERVTMTPVDTIDGFRSHVRLRNHWSLAWGDHGSGRLHLSTLEFLGHYADYKQAVPLS